MDRASQLESVLLASARSISAEQVRVLAQQPFDPTTSSSYEVRQSTQSSSKTTVSEIDQKPRHARWAIRKARSSKGPKKGVNGFMAFRAYYSPQLPGRTQKVRSRLIRPLWQTEGRKNIWALIGNAFTDVRDNHTSSVRLHDFLATIIPQLPIIPADSYLQQRGLELVTGSAGETCFKHAPTVYRQSLLGRYPEETNQSVEDLVQLCYASGLLRPDSRRHEAKTQGKVVKMPFVAAPLAVDQVFQNRPLRRSPPDPLAVSTTGANVNSLFCDSYAPFDFNGIDQNKIDGHFPIVAPVDYHLDWPEEDYGLGMYGGELELLNLYANAGMGSSV